MDSERRRTRVIGALTRAANEPWVGRIALTLAVVLLVLAIWPDGIVDGLSEVWDELGLAVRLSLAALCFGVALALGLRRRRERLAAWVGVISLLLPLVALVGHTTASVVDDDPAPDCARPYRGDTFAAPRQHSDVDPGHNGRRSTLDAIVTPELLWQAPAFPTTNENWPVQSPALAVDDEGVYLVSGGFTTSLDEEFGQPWWFYRFNIFGPASYQPAVTSEMVVTNGPVEALTALDRDGTPIWTVEQPRVSDHSSPVVAGGVFAYDNEHRRLLAFDVTDGRLCWTVEGNGGSQWGWSPSAYAGDVYAVLGGALVALDAGNGSERWRFQPEDDPSLAAGWPVRGDGPSRLRAPAVAEDDVYLISPAGNLYAIDRLTGELNWQMAIGQADGGPAIADRDLVYLTSDRETDPKLLAIDRRTGEIRWTRPYAGAPVLVPFYAPNNMLLVADAGYVRALDGESGADLWAFPLEGAWFTQPAVDDARIYIANNQGTVFALSDATRQPLPPASTPVATPAATPETSGRDQP